MIQKVLNLSNRWKEVKTVKKQSEKAWQFRLSLSLQERRSFFVITQPWISPTVIGTICLRATRSRGSFLKFLFKPSMADFFQNEQPKHRTDRRSISHKQPFRLSSSFSHESSLSHGWNSNHLHALHFPQLTVKKWREVTRSWWLSVLLLNGNLSNYYLGVIWQEYIHVEGRFEWVDCL